MRGLLFIAICFCFGLHSCVDAPEYPIIPHIEFKSVSSTQLKSGQLDTLTFSFTDGDGDIGVTIAAPDTAFTNSCKLQEGDSSDLRNQSFNIFLIDNKTLCIDMFASATVPSGGKYKGISGDIVVIQRIFTTKCIVPTPGCPPDTANYTIVIRDKAGHLSNFIQAPPIIIDGEP